MKSEHPVYKTPNGYAEYVKRAAKHLRGKPLSNHFVHQQAKNQYHYDHTFPTALQHSVGWGMLEDYKGIEDIAAIREYGEEHGLWYYDLEHFLWVSPPKRVWTDV